MGADTEQQAGGLRAQLADLQAKSAGLEQSNAELRARLREQQQQAGEYLRQLTAMKVMSDGIRSRLIIACVRQCYLFSAAQDAASAQRSDMMSALELVSTSRRVTKQQAGHSDAPHRRSASSFPEASAAPRSLPQRNSAGLDLPDPPARAAAGVLPTSAPYAAPRDNEARIVAAAAGTREPPPLHEHYVLHRNSFLPRFREAFTDDSRQSPDQVSEGILELDKEIRELESLLSAQY